MSYNTEQNFVKNNTDYIKYSSIINQIKKLSETDKPTIIAIDGRCGSGKSY